MHKPREMSLIAMMWNNKYEQSINLKITAAHWNITWKRQNYQQY